MPSLPQRRLPAPRSRTLGALGLLWMLAATCLPAQSADRSPWELLRAAHDRDGNLRITAEEYTRGPERFRRLDRDGDGVLTRRDLLLSGTEGAIARRVLTLLNPEEESTVGLAKLTPLFARLDQDRDQTLSPAELGARRPRRGGAPSALPAGLDRDGNGVVSAQELEQLMLAFDVDGDRVLGAAEQTLLQKAGSQRRGGRKARPKAPPVGAWAPDFTLETPDGQKKVTLSEFRNQRPVALVFGNYT